ncbi:hypothetical protein GCM10008927_06410 [Amylibacter ulvae]|uniref:Lipoprotein n=1 Tax=Paramylibacter ulvae TaxID=1651968 RepID=A0ABQ3CY92_9RHOB|nr:hypothetical protein [Amylibacter ulvae]GHA44336.1 hypothetical protein GCM10008927_06410 [Amylibacter ulvae]
MKKILTISTILLISACAKSPDKIPAANLGASHYSDASCSTLAKNQITLRQNLEAQSAAQKSAQTGDALGVFLIGVPMSSMAGADKETEIAVTKGKLNAIERQQAAKRCI